MNKIKELTDFYMWMHENDYEHNIRARVEKKAEMFLNRTTAEQKFPIGGVIAGAERGDEMIITKQGKACKDCRFSCCYSKGKRNLYYCVNKNSPRSGSDVKLKDKACDLWETNNVK